MQKNHCVCALRCYSLPMQANTITDDFNTQTQSDEFAAEFNAWLDEQELKYWQEMDTRSN